jgi:hypothetical protein
MTRAILLALLLGACGPSLLEETGAPPRPWPPTVVVKVVEQSREELETTARIAHTDWRGHGADRLLGMAMDTGMLCRIFILRGLSDEERERVLAHEKRHCTGQQHITRTVDGRPVVVWLP